MLHYLKNILLLLSGFFILPVLLNAQIHNFHTFSTEEGLPQSQVRCIEQDQFGYLWCGTNGGGLAMYDGYEFATYTMEDGLSGNTINDLLSDTEGNLWVCSDGGLTIIPPEKRIFTDTIYFRSMNDPVNGEETNITKKLINPIYTVSSSPQGNYWLAGEKGIIIYNQNSGFTSPEHIPDEPFYALFWDKKQYLWVGGERKLLKIEKDTLVAYPLPGSYNHINIIREGFDSKTLLIGTEKGLLTFKNGVFSKTNIHPVLKNKSVSDIYTDKNAIIWFATDLGLIRYNKDFTEHFTISEGLSSNVIRNIMQDREGNLWIGTNGGGLIRYRNDLFVRFAVEKGEKVNLVLSLAADNKNNIWIGTYSGLYVKEGQSIKPFLVSNMFEQFRITAIYADEAGAVWYAVSGYGVFRYQDGNFQQYTTSNGLISNNITNIKEDKNGRIWFAADRGMTSYYKGRWRNLTSENGLPEAHINCLKQGVKNDLWIGTQKGLYYLKGDSIYPASIDQLKGQLIKSVTSDQDKGLWIATDNALWLYKDKSIHSFTTKDGLSSNLINALLYDPEEGMLWVGTNKGVDRLDVKGFYSSGEIFFTHFGKNEGFTGVECNPNAILKDKENKIWFGTVKGVVRYDPHKKAHSETAPIIHLTGIKHGFERSNWMAFADSFDAETGQPLKLQLPYDINDLTFDFLGMHLSSSGKVKYQYILEGFNESWSPVTNKTEATYTNLTPGNYTFKVAAATNQGVWSPEPAEFTFTIIRPYWQQWWFIAFTVILFILFTGLSFYFWMRRKVKKKELNEKIANLKLTALQAQMNPHFIFNSLNAIQNFINKNDEEAANIYLAKFAGLMRLILDNSRRSSVSLKEEIRLLKFYLDLEQLRFKNKFDYQLKLDESLQPEIIKLPPMLIQPYVENAVNHGIMHKKNKGNILIKFNVESRDKLICTVEDDGVGRKKAIEINKKKKVSHKSAAMNINLDRLEILSSMNGKGMEVKVTDLQNGAQKATGTKVEIAIPLGK